jgi:hypothetical protein
MANIGTPDELADLLIAGAEGFNERPQMQGLIQKSAETAVAAMSGSCSKCGTYTAGGPCPNCTPQPSPSPAPSVTVPAKIAPVTPSGKSSFNLAHLGVFCCVAGLTIVGLGGLGYVAVQSARREAVSLLGAGLFPSICWPKDQRHKPRARFGMHIISHLLEGVAMFALIFSFLAAIPWLIVIALGIIAYRYYRAAKAGNLKPPLTINPGAALKAIQIAIAGNSAAAFEAITASFHLDVASGSIEHKLLDAGFAELERRAKDPNAKLPIMDYIAHFTGIPRDAVIKAFEAEYSNQDSVTTITPPGTRRRQWRSQRRSCCCSARWVTPRISLAACPSLVCGREGSAVVQSDGAEPICADAIYDRHRHRRD